LTPAWYQWNGADLVLSVPVQPGAKTDRIDGLHGERLKIRISAPPADGKANAHLIGFLARLFGVPRRQVSLLSGTTGRSKRIRIVRPIQLLADIRPPAD
jgi:uncharacterized protein (TIGR00251 family)